MGGDKVAVVSVDTCLLIEVIRSRLGYSVDPERQDCIWIMDRLLGAAMNRDVLVYHSTFTGAELLYVKGDDGKPDQSATAQKLITDMVWSNKHGLVPAHPTPFTFQRIRDLAWKRGVFHKASDLVHLASAAEVGASEFLTLDGSIPQPVVEAVNEEWRLQVIPAKDTSALPENYRQMEINS